MSGLVAVLAGVTVTVLFIGAFRPARSAAVRRRAERLWATAPVEPEEEPFATRVLRPMGGALLRSASALLPQTLVTSVEARLQTAGLRVSATQFLVRWLGFGLAPPVLLLALILVAGSPERMTLLATGGWIAGGAYLPMAWLRRQADGRTKAINRELPDAIDMIVTSVEAGLGIQQAMMTVAEKFRGAVGEEFGRVVAETSIGRARSDAMLDMAVRSGSRDLMLFVRAMNQAEDMGISIGEVLRNQAAEIRERRQQYAREQAAKIPVKMTIPTVLLMLPTLFILILTPVILNALDSFD